MLNKLFKKQNGMTLLELILSMTMLGMIMVGGTALSNSTGWMSSMQTADLKVQADLAQIFVQIEQDLKAFAGETVNNPYRIETGSDNNECFLRILNSANNGIVYRFNFSVNGLVGASVTRSNITAGAEAGTPVVLYKNVANQFPILMPAALMDKDYNSDSNVQNDADKILSCSKDAGAFDASCLTTTSKINWMFEASDNDRVVYISFRLVNKMKGVNRPVISKVYTRTMFLHAQS